MGKSEDKPEQDSTDEEKVVPELAKEPTPEEKVVEEKKPTDEIVKDVNSIRKVIKVNQNEGQKKGEESIPEENKKEEKKPEPLKKEENNDAPGDLGDMVSGESSGNASEGGETTRENLEQKRAILQNIKDFDFQIKKNQEDIGGINQKMDGLSKDLDDLVSLYEIVSEQMNPFVGLSKVTKKRLDALETFTKEIDLLKERTGELESFAERSGAKLKSIAEGEVHAKTIDTDDLLGGDSKVEGEVPEIESETEVPQGETDGEIPPEGDALVTTELPSEPENLEEEKPEEESVEDIDDETSENFSDIDLDKIIEMSLSTLSLDDRMDMFIDEFIESLKR